MSYRQWLTELLRLNRQLQVLAQQAQWQSLEMPAGQYLQLASTPPAASETDRQQCLAEQQTLLAEHQQLTGMITLAMQQASAQFSQGRQQQKLLKAYFSV